MLRTNERDEAYATIFVGGDDVGLHLIREGLAWFSPSRATAQNDADQTQYKSAEAAAKAAKLGLWDDKEPVAPWAFRGEKMEAPAAVQTPARTVRFNGTDATNSEIRTRARSCLYSRSDAAAVTT